MNREEKINSALQKAYKLVDSTGRVFRELVDEFEDNKEIADNTDRFTIKLGKRGLLGQMNLNTRILTRALSIYYERDVEIGNGCGCVLPCSCPDYLWFHPCEPKSQLQRALEETEKEMVPKKLIESIVGFLAKYNIEFKLEKFEIHYPYMFPPESTDFIEKFLSTYYNRKVEVRTNNILFAPKESRKRKNNENV
jgi:hypothetical protein